MTTKLKGRPPEEVKPGHPKFVVYSKEGGGKTWLGLQFPRVYVIDTEGGARLKHYMARLKAAGGSYLGPEDGACDFDFIINEVKTLATEKHTYQTLLIDSITKVFQDRIATEAARLGEKDAFGASKKPAVAKMRQLISWISKLDMNVIVTAHEIAVWGEDGKGGRKQIGVGPDAWDKLAYELDLTLRIEKHQQGFRTATVDKSRLLGFPEFSRFELQKDNVDVGYANFAARYGKDFIEAAPKAIVLATPDQVTEINRLLGVVKIEQDELDKWLAKASAETWADLTTEQAEKTIAALTAKINGGK